MVMQMSHRHRQLISINSMLPLNSNMLAGSLWMKLVRVGKIWLNLCRRFVSRINFDSPYSSFSVLFSTMRLTFSTLAVWVLPVIVASSTPCSGPDSSCSANDMEEANVLLQMSEVNDMGTDALSADAIPPKEEKKGKKGFFGKYWKPKWYRHSPFYRRRSPHPTTSPLTLLLGRR